jgi:hypothetical protein
MSSCETEKPPLEGGFRHINIVRSARITVIRDRVPAKHQVLAPLIGEQLQELL